MAKQQASKKKESTSGAATPKKGEVYRVFRGRPAGEGAAEDRLIHQRTRLAIVSMLAVNEALTFNQLKEMLDTTDGNLSVHARKLEEGGYVGCKKSFRGRVPRTEYRITARGRQALERYLDHMESLIQAVRDR